MYINIDKSGALDALKKKIAECVIAEATILRALEGMNTVKHRKAVDKSVVTAIQKLGGYSSLKMDYTPRISLYFDSDKRVYRNSKPDANGVTTANYFSETEVDIYFTGGYAEMIEATMQRLEGVIASRERYQKEHDDINAIVEAVKALHKAYKKVETYSYITREAFGIK